MPANMQAVCSVKLAVASFRAGGMATVDQFRSVTEAGEMVRKVKKQKAEVCGAIGATKDYLERAEVLVKAGVKALIMDSPHAFHILTREAVTNIRTRYQTLPLIVGNVGTAEGADMLFRLGVDCVKVGIGPGAACLTRINTGTGMPQITAILDCYKVAQKYKKTILADGGVKTPGDFAKAIAAGGSAVYAGSIFAGTDEAPGKLIIKGGQKYKEYWGSSSEHAKEKRAKADPLYKERASRFVEGGKGLTLYEGSVMGVYERFAMGLKSAMSYSGASNITQFQKKRKFVRVTSSGIRENGAHGLV
jgi:IMP dehydrogenase